MLSDTFAGISPSSVPGFVIFQVVGAAVACLALRLLYPDFTDTRRAVIVPQETSS
jgi:glycerol uptake facilitator-like aquaporin